MGIYGSLPKVDVNQFVFDKVYPNRAAMDAAAAEDGVFPGRYVRIEYDLGNGYSENQKTDLNKYKDVNSNGGRDYDATVWQKYINDEGKHKYVMVAELQPTTYVIDWLKYDGQPNTESTKDELYGINTGGTYLVKKWLQDTEIEGGTKLVNDWLQEDEDNGGTYLVKEWLKDSANNITGTAGGTKLVNDFIITEQAEWNSWETQAKQDFTEAKSAADTATANANTAASAANTAANLATSGAGQVNEALSKVQTAESAANIAAKNANAAAKTANEAADKIEGVLEGVNITFKTDNGSATSTSFTVSDDNIIQASAPETNSLSFVHADSGVAANTYGTNNTVPRITVNKQGHITNVEEQSISIPPATTVNGSSGAITIKSVDNNPISVTTTGTKNIIEFTWPTDLVLQCTL